MIQPTYLFIGLNSCMAVYNSFSAQITQKGRVLVNIACGFLLLNSTVVSLRAKNHWGWGPW